MMQGGSENIFSCRNMFITVAYRRLGWRSWVLLGVLNEVGMGGYSAAAIPKCRIPHIQTKQSVSLTLGLAVSCL